MTVMIDEVATPSMPQPRWLRRHWRAVVASLVAALVLAAGVGWLVYANTYQPLGSAGFSTTGASDPNLRVATDGLNSHTYLLDSAPGQPTTVEYTFANNGPFAITIPAQTAYAGTPYAATYRWSILRRPGDLIIDAPVPVAEAHPLPLVLRPHEAFELYVTMKRPQCGSESASWVEALPIRWQALGVHHTTTIALDPQSDDLYPIAICFRRAALQHSVRP